MDILENENIEFFKHYTPPFYQTYPRCSSIKSKLKNIINNLNFDKSNLEFINVENKDDLIFIDDKINIYILDEYILDKKINDRIKIIENYFKDLIYKNKVFGIEIKDPLIYFSFSKLVPFISINLKNITKFYKILSGENKYYYLYCDKCYNEKCDNCNIKIKEFTEKINSPNKYISIDDDGKLFYNESLGNSKNLNGENKKIKNNLSNFNEK